MNYLLQYAGIALEQMKLRYGVDPKGEELFVLFDTPDGKGYALVLRANEDAHDLTIMCPLVHVNPRRRSQVALCVAELSSRYKHVTYSLVQDHVLIDVVVDLENVHDKSKAIRRGVVRLLYAIQETRSELLRLAGARTSTRPVKAVTEAEQLLEEMGF